MLFYWFLRLVEYLILNTQNKQSEEQRKMSDRNNKRAKQLLQIDVDSEEDYLQQQEQMEQEQQEQQEQAASDDDSDFNSHQHQSEQAIDNSNHYDDDMQYQGNSSEQKQSQLENENYYQQSSSFHHQQTHLQSINSHTFQTTQQQSAKYKSTFNQQQYLIVQNENQSYGNNSLSLYPPQTTSKNVQKVFAQENDQEVDKIIQEVLFKRKHKQKQKQMIENIINSERNHNFPNQLNSKDQSTTRLQFVDPTFRKQKKQKTELNSYQSMIKKCKQLQTRINRMTKKQLERQKLQSNKQSLKQKKQKLMSKKELSLEKLKKRLQKALSLNSSLTKRVKLQKSQLASISIMKNQSQQMQQPTINQESTIKGAQSVSLMSKNGQKYYVEDTFRSSFKNSYEQLSGVGVSRQKEKCAKKSQKSKQKKAIVTNKCMKDSQKNKTSSSVQQHISSFSPSPAIYKSPILQFNSYLIDESQYKSPSTVKENIYIEDDMNSQPNQEYQNLLQHSSDKNNQENQRLLEQLKALMGEYLSLEMKEKSLQQRVNSNQIKIKEYEDEYYHKIVAE